MTDKSRARADYRAIKGMQEYASHQIEVAFKKGFDQCDKQLQEACDNARREGYGEGLNAAWECARKIIPLWEKGKTADIFGTRDIETIFKGYFASDAMSKIKEYEEEQNDDEVKVGDEMVAYADDKSTTIIVTYVSEDGHIDGIDSEGMGYTHRYLAYWTKTGRHFPQIAETLKRLKGAE